VGRVQNWEGDVGDLVLGYCELLGGFVRETIGCLVVVHDMGQGWVGLADIKWSQVEHGEYGIVDLIYMCTFQISLTRNLEIMSNCRYR
jgi:hypothetical protein